MCCRKNRQSYFEQQALYSPPARGCCGRRQAHFQTYTQNTSNFAERPTMAGLLAISLGLGAEKLGRTISEKRLERKEKKAIAQHEAIYGSSSSAPPAPITTREKNSRTEKKREEAQRALDEARREPPSAPQYESRRRSMETERVSNEEPPPSYDDAVRHDEKRS
ncbi:hypothetical protein J4E93_003293 [Alternaria ventricosa]|uniref:uncharacterized protein n=1 Tax=Alternaria ventricosa TaxID=1187951 RepID=UPI0020C5A4F6|nr:uncharacterized protein J4E93_003293 [Alternaria ventricosa]KAI4650936.1 hypothetical protein J4E93_003293 [Alternaria ventricosa]